MAKLALLDRAGVDPADLLVAQRVVVEPIVEAPRADRDRALGLDRTLAEWWYDTAVAMLVYRTGLFGFNRGGAAALPVMLLVALNALQLRVLRKDHTK